VTVEALTQSKDQLIQRRFLYADYSFFDDDVNVIEMLKEFVSVTSTLLRLNSDYEKVTSLITTASSLTNDVVALLNQQSSNTIDIIDNFYKKYPDPLATEMHTSTVALVNDAKKNILTLLASTKTGLDEQYRKYKSDLFSRISNNHSNVVSLLERWLSNDYKNLPCQLLSRLTIEIMIVIDPVDPKAYSINRSCKTTNNAIANADQNVKGMSIFPINYKFQINTSELAFWRSIRKISEFGLQGVELPIGMKAPLSEKLKDAFKLGNKKYNIVMKPEFVKIDNYAILSIKLDEKMLVVQTVPDITEPDIDFIEITYDLSELQAWRRIQLDDNVMLATQHPRIDYRSKNDGQTVEFTDSLAIRQITDSTNLTQIMNLGTSILEKLKTLEDSKILSSSSKLQVLNICGKNVIVRDDVTRVEFTQLFELLYWIANHLAPFVKRLKEKTPVHGELILHEQLENGQRTEFAVKLEYLRSQLSSCSPMGQKIIDSLQL